MDGLLIKGVVVDIDYSHGTIYFYVSHEDDVVTCTWSGFIDLQIGDEIKAIGANEASFDDASSYEPNSAKLIND